MVTQIYYRNGWRNVNPEQAPKDFRMLDAFLIYNNAARNIVRIQGVYYKICMDGVLKFISRALYLVSMAEFLSISNNDNYCSN